MMAKPRHASCVIKGLGFSLEELDGGNILLTIKGDGPDDEVNMYRMTNRQFKTILKMMLRFDGSEMVPVSRVRKATETCRQWYFGNMNTTYPRKTVPVQLVAAMLEELRMI